MDISGAQRLIREIHRRSLWQVLLIYVGGSWAVLELVDHVIGRFGMPDWAYGFAVTLLLLGLPFVVATAFIQEAPTPAGMSGERRPDPPSEIAAREDGSEAEPAGGPAARVFTWRNAALGGAAALAIWGAVAAGWVVLRAATRGPPANGADADRRSIAVLPFENLSADEENRFFADGVHEDVLLNLSRISELRVISRTSVLEYRERTTNLREIAEELGVSTVLEGSVRREGDRVRVTVQLVDAVSDEHLWGQAYDRTLTDIFTIQSEIASRIASALHTELAPDEASRLERVPTTSLAAYDLLTRSRRLQAHDPEENAEAIELLWEAVSLDPRFAEAYAALSYRYSARVTLGEGEAVADSTLILAGRALELQPNLAAAHHALASHYSWLGHYEQADSAFRRALDINPNATEVMNQLSLSLVRRHRLDDALVWANRALERDPHGPRNHFWLAFVVMVMSHEQHARRAIASYERRYPDQPETAGLRIELDLDHGRVEEAWTRARRAMARFPENRSLRMLASDVALSVDPAEARRLLEPFFREAPDAESYNYYGRTYRTHYAYALRETGDTARARSLIDQAIDHARNELDRGNESPFLLTELAALHALRGERESALEWLGRANERGFAMPCIVRYDPLLAGLRAEPRFQDVLRDMDRRLAAMHERATALDLWPRSPDPSASSP